MKTLDLIIPLFNEAEHLAANLAAIRSVAREIPGVECRLLLVDDGSTDGTVAAAQAFCEHHPETALVCLNRNYGKEAAIQAGLVNATGDGVVVMDSDLQHPPELLPDMVRLWLAGMPLVEACRASRGYESRLRRVLALGFYRFFERVSGFNLQNQTDFKLLDRSVVEAYLQLPEHRRFFRGLLVWMGIPGARLPFEVPRSARSSRWSLWRMFVLSVEAITSFSTVPLHLITVSGVVTLLGSGVLGGTVLYQKFSGRAVDGFTTVIGLQLFLGSLLMVGLGLIGIYIGRIYEEIKRRPGFMVNREASRLTPKKARNVARPGSRRSE